jgi:hypothetical protein
MTTVTSLRVSSQRGLDLTLSSLLKGWVYVAEEVRTEVKAEVVNPDQYLTLDAPLTRQQLKRKIDDQHETCIASSGGLRTQPRPCLHPFLNP